MAYRKHSVRHHRCSLRAMLLGTAAYGAVMALLLLRASAGSSPVPNAGENMGSAQTSSILAKVKQQMEMKQSDEKLQHSERVQGYEEKSRSRKSKDKKELGQTDEGLKQQHSGKKLQQKRNDLSARLPPSATLQYRHRCWQANYSCPERRPVDHTPRPFLLGSGSAPCRGEIFLLVVVQSAVPNRARRDLIRVTWAAVANIGGDRLQTLFFVGTTTDAQQMEQLRRESDSRADIVQADFIDTYRNLTYKHLYSLRWIAESCRSVRYVMKVDDDVVVNVFRLRESLREHVGSRTGDFFYCEVSSVTPIRDRGIKWQVTYEEYPGDQYPDYCKGYGYVMTGSLIEKLHHCAKWRRYFWIDDVFVSGELASALGVPRVQWEDGWGAKRLHPRLAGPEAAQLVVANAGGNSVAPSLHRRIWRAVVRFSDWGWEDSGLLT